MANQQNSMHPVKAQLVDLIRSHKNPIAIFDIDGTLFNVTHRTLEILRQFSAESEIKERFATELKALTSLTPASVKYALEATLNGCGISRHSERGAEFLHEAESYWFKRFFTDEFVLHDRAFAGAADCVNWFFDHGVHIVYLSGRDIPNMSRGTIAALERDGFPVKGDRISMVLKPDYHMDDLLFKTQSIETIRSEGEVIATFDNEPANVAMFLQEFPDAINVHFKSEYARWMELSGKNLLAISSFEEIGF